MNLLLTVLLALPAPAPQEAGLRAGLDVSAIDGGGVLTARLRSTENGAPARILLGPAAVISLAPPNDLLLVDPGTGRTFSGTIGADGLFTVTQPLPPSLSFSGRVVAVQGGVLTADGARLSARHGVIADASAPATFAHATAALPASAQAANGGVQAVDYDRDGDLDLVVAGGSTAGGGTVGGVKFFTNVGGALMDETAQRLPAGENLDAFVTAWADFDGDGFQDLLIAGREDALGDPLQPVLYYNDGSGVFGSSVGSAAIATGLNAAIDVTVGDVDGDGDLDLAFVDGAQHSTSSGPQVLSLVRDQGGLQGGTPGTYAADAAFLGAPFNTDVWTAAALDFGDVDNDGDLDLVVARTSGGPGADNLLLANDGSGGFTDVSATQLPFFLDKSSDAELVDLDQDGWLDLVFTNSHISITPAQSGDVLYNSGASAPGTFVDGAGRFPDVFDEDAGIRLFVSTGDVDADGDVDVVIASHEFFGSAGGFVGHPVLYLNQGGVQGGTLGDFLRDPGFFESSPGVPIETFIPGGAALFDLDGDGDLEYYVSATGGIVDPQKTQDVLLLNRLR